MNGSTRTAVSTSVFTNVMDVETKTTLISPSRLGNSLDDRKEKRCSSSSQTEHQVMLKQQNRQLRMHAKRESRSSGSTLKKVRLCIRTTSCICMKRTASHAR